MVPTGNKKNAYAKFGGTNKGYYGIVRSSLMICAFGGRSVVNNRGWKINNE